MTRPTEQALERAGKYIKAPRNESRFNKVVGSKEWFVLQVGLVAGQLLEGLPRLNRAYDLSRFAEVFEFEVKSASDIGAKTVLDDMVHQTEMAMLFLEEARPEKYDKYSKDFLRDIFKVVYNLEE